MNGRPLFCRLSLNYKFLLRELSRSLIISSALVIHSFSFKMCYIRGVWGVLVIRKLFHTIGALECDLHLFVKPKWNRDQLLI